MIRVAAVVACLAVLAVVVGTPATDPLRQAALISLARSQASAADEALADAEAALRLANDHVRAGQSAIFSGDGDPAHAMTEAGSAYEMASGPVGDASRLLENLAWTLRALDEVAVPELTLTAADVRAIGAQWHAAALPSSSLADIRRHSEAVLVALEDALQALDAGDAAGARDAVDRAEAEVEPLREVEGMAILAVWVETVDALIEATRAITDAAEAGDETALAEARADYALAAAEAHRADQALSIALAEAATRVTGPGTASAALALGEVVTARDSLAGLSILR